jgi:uncharacterized membrane protein YphA (DoxX/SURF4 family)
MLSFQGKYPTLFSETFLHLNIGLQLLCPIMIIAHFKIFVAIVGLLLSITLQIIFLRLYNDLNLILILISLTGGLLLLLSDYWLVKEKESKQKERAHPGLLLVDHEERNIYLQLFGRIFLTFLYFSSVFSVKFDSVKIFLAVVGFLPCAAVVIGFKTKFASIVLLILFLSLNIFLNDFWAAERTSNAVRFQFFQILSATGGFLLLFFVGPGGISLDERKKKK